MRREMRAVVICLVLAPAALGVGGDALKKWQADLQIVREEFPNRHTDPFHALPREEFERLLAKLEADLPALTENQIIVRLAQVIVTTAGDRDGHTGLMLRPRFRMMPVEFFLYTDGLHVRAAAKSHADLAGARVLTIGGIPAEDAFRTIRTIASGDNDQSRIASASALLSLPAALRALAGIGGEPEAPMEIVGVHAGGRRVRAMVAPLENFEGIEWVDVRKQASPPPLYLRHANPDPYQWYAPAKGLWYEYLPEKKALYVHYGAVADGPDETVAQFFGRVFAFADANPVEKFIVDLRQNGGGNNTLNRPFLHGMIRREDSIGRQGRFFVLIGRRTFSAAQNIVTQLDVHTNAIFVGEPTGGSPNHYGDATRIQLPNSGLRVRASTLWWQDSHPADSRLWIAPHIASENTSADDRAGRDPALDAVLAHRPEPSLSDRLRAALPSGRKEVSAALEAWRRDPRHKYLRGESEVNELGVALYREDKAAQAVLLFEINAEAHPDSWRAQQSLGRAYEAAGRKDEAIAAFRRAVRLSDDATFSKERLVELEKK
jgi:tetratricopeptide (TPR) repeat protein